jgi:hypothetical protein
MTWIDPSERLSQFVTGLIFPHSHSICDLHLNVLLLSFRLTPDTAAMTVADNE